MGQGEYACEWCDGVKGQVGGGRWAGGQVGRWVKGNVVRGQRPCGG